MTAWAHLFFSLMAELQLFNLVTVVQPVSNIKDAELIRKLEYIWRKISFNKSAKHNSFNTF